MSEAEIKMARKAHEEFKLIWMQMHGYSMQDLINQLEAARQDLFDEEASMQTVFEHWEDNVGFGGEIWPCFDEYLDNEYKIIEEFIKANGDCV